MQVRHSLTLPFPRALVWTTLQNLEAVATCVPGGKLDGPPEDGKLRGTMTAKLGPIQAQFAGQGTVTMDDAAFSGSLGGSGADRKSGSRAKGAVGFVLVEEDPDATRIDLTLDYELTGALAQFGRPGIVQDLVGRIAQQFAGNLERLITERQAGSTAAPDQAAPLNAGSLLKDALKDAVVDRFKRPFRRSAETG